MDGEESNNAARDKQALGANLRGPKSSAMRSHCIRPHAGSSLPAQLHRTRIADRTARIISNSVEGSNCRVYGTMAMSLTRSLQRHLSMDLAVVSQSSASS